MSKKPTKKRQPKTQSTVKETPRAPVKFGYDEMLSELEAIVADAAIRQSEDEAAA